MFTKNRLIYKFIFLFIVLFSRCCFSQIEVFDLFEDCDEGDHILNDDNNNNNDIELLPLHNDANIVLIIINWNGQIGAKTEQSVWKASTHPNIVAHLNIQISSTHRAKNLAINQIVNIVKTQVENAKEDKEIGVFSHILLVNQDISFDIEDIDKLMNEDKDFIAGLTPSRKEPYYPSFIPIINENYIKTNKISLHNMFDYYLNNNEIFKVRAVSPEMILMKVSALQGIGKHFSNNLEWFWLSEQSNMWAVGDCYEILNNPILKSEIGSSSYTVQETKEYFSLLNELKSNVQEEDLCFAKNLKRFGYSIYVHPEVRPTVSKIVDINYKTNSLSILPREIENPMIIENRLKLASTRKMAMDRKGRQSSTVVATAIWSSMYSSTVSSLYGLGTHSDIIGRVSIDFTEISLARNLLVRKIEEEFKDYTHILFVDGDMDFDYSDFDELVAADVGIACGIAVKRLSKMHPPAYLPLSGDPIDYRPLLKSLESKPPPAIPIKGAGMAFTLVKREVFKSIARDSVTYPGEKEWFWTEHVIDEDSHREQHLSEDYCFCRRAREAGYTIKLVPSVVVGHVDEVTVTISDWLTELGVVHSKV